MLVCCKFRKHDLVTFDRKRLQREDELCHIQSVKTHLTSLRLHCARGLGEGSGSARSRARGPAFRRKDPTDPAMEELQSQRETLSEKLLKGQWGRLQNMDAHTHTHTRTCTHIHMLANPHTGIHIHTCIHHVCTYTVYGRALFFSKPFLIKVFQK